MSERYIYETRHVSKGRKAKYCSACSKNIPIGASSITVTVSGDEFHAVHVCNDKCLTHYEKHMNLDDEDYCQTCEEEIGTEDMHTCPYKEDIYGDITTLCNCCDTCTQHCKDDI